ncbi:MAG: hypothetical protein ABSD20_12045 [Terriglobales bacterium]|jgi:hypothetical protein
MRSEVMYTVASEDDLNELLAGKEAGSPTYWRGAYLAPGATGVLWEKGQDLGDPVRPLAIVVRDEESRRLFGRVAYLRGDLSPLTSWCYLLTPDLFDQSSKGDSEPQKYTPELGGLEAAWSGLAIAEAQLLTGKPMTSLRFSACLATLSYAVSRSKALWPSIADIEIARRFDAANKLLRLEKTQRESRTDTVRAALRPIWLALLEAPGRASESGVFPIVASIRALREARSRHDPYEAERFASPLLRYADVASSFVELPQLRPESRLKLFDRVLTELRTTAPEDRDRRRPILALLAGYLATIAAGGAPALSLAEDNAERWPEITAWAYVVGGIGERVVWTSSFDGLGRLVARELMRPLRLEDPPSCDIALDEASVLVDAKLADPLVHLRLKQARIATVALFPGVNVSVPIGEFSKGDAGRRGKEPVRPPTVRVANDPIAVLGEALWAYLRPRIKDLFETDVAKSASDINRRKSKHGVQRDLPLANPKR